MPTMRSFRLVVAALLLAPAAGALPARATTPRAARPAPPAVPRVDLGRCLTDRALNRGAARPWRGCPAAFPAPVGVARVPDAPLPQCAAVPGVNDRCEKWQARYTQPTRGIAGMVSGGGRVFVAGTGVRGDNGVESIVVGAFGGTGKALWSSSAPVNLPTHATSIALSRDAKTVYVGGFLTLRPNINSLTFDYYYVLALDAVTGRARWVGQYPGQGANTNRVIALTVSRDGRRVYATGFSQRVCSICQVVPADWATVAYDAHSGKPKWVARYSGKQGGQNIAVSVAVSPNGRQVFVTGLSERPTLQPAAEYDYATAAYAASTGRQQWVKRYSSGLVDAPVAVLVAPKGDVVYVAGSGADLGSGGTSPRNYTVLAYRASNGGQRWKAAYRDVAGTENVAMAAALSPRGDRVFVTGQAQQKGSATPSGGSFVSVAQSTVAFAGSSGKRLWATPFAPNGEPAVGTAITVNPAGSKVYVGGVIGMPVPVAGLVGWSATTAYAASTGKPAWTARYDARDPGSFGYSTPVAVVCSPDGKTVYEAAQSAAVTAAAGQSDFAGLVLGFAG
jgi:hypothetical protein